MREQLSGLNLGNQKSMNNKIYTGLVILFGVVLFVLFSQPVWRGEEMLAELRLNCDKRGGVLLEHEKRFGTEYRCVSRLDNIK